MRSVFKKHQRSKSYKYLNVHGLFQRPEAVEIHVITCLHGNDQSTLKPQLLVFFTLTCYVPDSQMLVCLFCMLNEGDERFHLHPDPDEP